MPRINRAIELLEAGQPIYYTGVHGGLTYENGTAHRDTWADYLMVEFEHGAFNPVGLGEFMRGLADAGETRSGHRTPTVICTLPTDGTDENVMRANAWMVKAGPRPRRSRNPALPRRDPRRRPCLRRVLPLSRPRYRSLRRPQRVDPGEKGCRRTVHGC